MLKSGNPGYIINMPVLVSETDTGVRRVNQNGFKFFSQDSQGLCFNKVDNVGTLTYNSVDFDFGSDAQMSCGVKLNSDQLKSYCTTGVIGDLQKSKIHLFAQVI